MSREVLTTLLLFSYAMRVFPLVFILQKGRNLQPPFRWLAIFLFVSFSFDIMGFTLIFFFDRSPNIASNFYTLIQIIFISTFFYFGIDWRALKSKLISINVLYVIFALTNLFFIQKSEVNSYSNTISSIIIITFCIVYYYKLIKELPTQQVQRLPLFWIVSGFFFSHAGKLVIYAATHYLIHFLKDNLVVIWTVHVLLTIMGDLLIAYGCWLNMKEPDLHKRTLTT